jgi:glyoxylase-like metal-dependent hydrolase (beta-lactamase superfamily II)
MNTLFNNGGMDMNLKITPWDTNYQLTFFKNEALSVNCYLVEEDNGIILIDTGVYECATGVAKTIHAMGKPLTRIVLTHGHHDHAGGMDELHLAFPDALVYTSAREDRILTGDRTLDPDEPDSPLRGNFQANLTTKANVLLHDGDRVGPLLALSTPGHTPGSISLLDVRNRVLLAGDALQTAGGIAVAGQLRPAFPYPAYGTWDARLSLQSARKLVNYRPSVLAVGHGELLYDPRQAMELAIEEAALTLS